MMLHAWLGHSPFASLGDRDISQLMQDGLAPDFMLGMLLSVPDMESVTQALLRVRACVCNTLGAEMSKPVAAFSALLCKRCFTMLAMISDPQMN